MREEIISRVGHYFLGSFLFFIISSLYGFLVIPRSSGASAAIAVAFFLNPYIYCAAGLIALYTVMAQWVHRRGERTTRILLRVLTAILLYLLFLGGYRVVQGRYLGALDHSWGPSVLFLFLALSLVVGLVPWMSLLQPLGRAREKSARSMEFSRERFIQAIPLYIGLNIVIAAVVALLLLLIDGLSAGSAGASLSSASTTEGSDHSGISSLFSAFPLLFLGILASVLWGIILAPLALSYTSQLRKAPALVLSILFLVLGVALSLLNQNISDYVVDILSSPHLPEGISALVLNQDWPGVTLNTWARVLQAGGVMGLALLYRAEQSKNRQQA